MINGLIERNHSYLVKVAKRIAPKHYHDLLTETYVSLVNANVPEENTEFIKYFSRCMSNNYRNQNSTFNKNFAIKEINCNFVTLIEPDEVNKEDLYSELLAFKNSLPTQEEILFELHFEFGLSAANIAKLLELDTGYNISTSSMLNLLKPIREKLRCKQWKSLNYWAYSRSRGYLLKGQNQRNTSSLF